jgi:ketosteroid isomerase-like protein
MTKANVADAERIYHEWDAALSNNDVEALLVLYHPDAVLESPLVPHLLGIESGICRGADEIRKLLEIVAERKPVKRKFYRKDYFTDGKTLMWEYPRVTPKGEQMDFVEIMELKDGLIHYHRVYWGWYGCNVLKNDEYHRE